MESKGPWTISSPGIEIGPLAFDSATEPAAWGVVVHRESDGEMGLLK